jgi:hypothetical protein
MLKKAHFPQLVVDIVIVTAFLCLKFLLDRNMSNSNNEVDVLPLARQYIFPNWIPEDWYLNQPAGYRLIFQSVFGNLAGNLGFLATSLLGRLFCYTLVATGIVLIGRKLALWLPSLLVAIGLFIYINRYQGMVAHEWLVGGLETKAIAYGLVLLSVYWMLCGRYGLMMLMLGLATSFHVLVGGWTFLAILGWLFLRDRKQIVNLANFARLLFIYAIASIFAIKPVFEQLLTPSPVSEVSSSSIYVFLRLPHHLNPLSWNSSWWLVFGIYLLFFAIGIRFLRNQAENRVYIDLAVFVVLTLVPFIAGLAIAPFDVQGKFLQYYPFRLGDIMLPFNTCLLSVCELQQAFVKRKKIYLCGCLILLSVACSLQAVEFQQEFLALSQFPGEEQKIDPQWKSLCNWVRDRTSRNANFISPPIDLDSFTWLSERPTVAQYKFLPQNKERILTWYERIKDLSGDANLELNISTRTTTKQEIEDLVTSGYNNLTTQQVKALMVKYKAKYFVTHLGHSLELPIAYSNSRYVIYHET